MLLSRGLFTHHPSLEPYSAGLAFVAGLLTSVSFRRPCRPFPLLQHLSHPSGATNIPRCRRCNWAQSPSHCWLPLPHCCILGVPSSLYPWNLNNSNSFIEFCQRPLGVAGSFRLRSVVCPLFEKGEGREVIDFRSFVFCTGYQSPEVSSDCQAQLETVY